VAHGGASAHAAAYILDALGWHVPERSEGRG